jgi:GPH family glycoside/pentoside/hexuronide:cation symporter
MTAAQPKLGFVTQFTYGLGSLSMGVGATIMSAGLLQLYFNQVLGLPAIWVGAAIMASIVVDAVIDPLIGRYSDGLKGVFGRRHTLMYASAIPSALAFWVVWHMPPGLSQPMMLGFMVLSLLVARIAISFYEIPSIALAPELATYTHDRTTLLAWRWFFVIVGAFGFALVVYRVFLAQDAGNPSGMLNAARYGDAGTVAAVVIGITILISTVATHHRIKHLHVPRKAERKSVREVLAECRNALADRQMLLILGAGTLMSLAQGTNDGLSSYEFLHFWGMKPQTLGIIVGAAGLAAFIALPVARPLSERLGKRRAMVTVFLIFLAATAMPPALKFAGLLPTADSPFLLPILAGFFLVAIAGGLTGAIITGSMLTDAMDTVAARTGLRAEGMTFGVFGVLTKWATGGGAFVAGAIVSVVGFPVRAIPGTVDPAIVNTLVILHIPLIVVLDLAAIFLLHQLALPDAVTTKTSAAPVTEAAG